MIISTILQFALGLSILIGGSELLVRSATFIAIRLKQKVFFISLFLLGIGTSAPELLITLQSHLKQESEMAIGNIFGSNIFNILVVSAVAFLTIFKIQNKQTILKSISLLIIVTLAVLLFIFDFSLSWWNGLLLLGLFTFFFIKQKQTEPEAPASFRIPSWPMTVLILVVGFGLLFTGTQITLNSTIQLGNQLGLSKRVLGLFLLSVGTSLPELTMAVMALFRKKSDIALGTIIGSNAFNTLFIPGVVALFKTLPISSEILKKDGIIMILSEILLLTAILLFKKIPNWLISFCFLSIYITYAYVVLWNRF